MSPLRREYERGGKADADHDYWGRPVDEKLAELKASREVTPRFKEPKKSKTAKRKLKKDTPTARADRYFSLIVRQRGACENCGALTDLQCAHGFSRRYRNTRWDFDNAWCLCKPCHMKYTQRPIEWDDWMRSHFRSFGGSYDRTRARAISPKKLVNVKDRAVDLEQMWGRYESESCGAGGETTPQ